MPYATASDIDTAYGTGLLDLLGDTENTGERNAAAIEEALADASASVDSYISARHRLPLATVPPVIRTLTIDLAVYRIACRRVGNLTTDIEERWKAAIAMLKDIGSGRAGLGLPSDQPSAQAPDLAVVVAPERRFTRDAW